MSRRSLRRESEEYYYESRSDRRESRSERRQDNERGEKSKKGPTTRPPYKNVGLIGLAAVCLLFAGTSSAAHHLSEPALHYVAELDSQKPLRIRNECAQAVYPAILTQSGFGPAESGFRLETGATKEQAVSADWRGRVWARTNCTFEADDEPVSGSGGVACQTGDCGQFVQCQGAGNPPATLAEFTFTSNSNQSYYDLSLVDGYNLPMGIISLLDPISTNHSDFTLNLANPVCIATAAFLAPIGDLSDALFGTNSSYPLPLDQSVSQALAQNWCPWPLLQQTLDRPSDGVYPYPDDKIERPAFAPCFSACAKWNEPGYCCTGKYNNPDVCRPSYYSIQAKKVCPDAYTYAFDDQTSTFIIPQGGGFEVVFCPASRSTNILGTFGDKLRGFAQSASDAPVLDTRELSRYQHEQPSSCATIAKRSRVFMTLFTVAALILCL